MEHRRWFFPMELEHYCLDLEYNLEWYCLVLELVRRHLRLLQRLGKVTYFDRSIHRPWCKLSVSRLVDFRIHLDVGP